MFLTIAILPILISIWGFKCLRKKGYNKLSFIFFLIPAILIYYLLTAIFPGKEFYKKEFQSNADLKFPASGIIIKKDATFPDQHGDYTSIAIIKLSQEDYETILTKLRTDESFKLFENFSSNNFLLDTVEFLNSENIHLENIDTLFVGTKKAQFKIGFMNDGMTFF